MAVFEHPVASTMFECEASRHNVSLVRRHAAEFARDHGAAPEVVDSVRIAVTEAVENVVRHAYPGGTGPVALEIDLEDGDLEVVVTDEGAGFAPARRPSVGLGLALMSESCTAFEVRARPAGGVEVWMRVPLGA
jgi:anti-sigma regulatory factor (Ser/Thr protein kinase)